MGYQLTIGDEFAGGGTREETIAAYNKALKAYIKSGGRPSLEPILWKKVKQPDRNKLFNKTKTT